MLQSNKLFIFSPPPIPTPAPHFRAKFSAQSKFTLAWHLELMLALALGIANRVIAINRKTNLTSSTFQLVATQAVQPSHEREIWRIGTARHDPKKITGNRWIPFSLSMQKLFHELFSFYFFFFYFFVRRSVRLSVWWSRRAPSRSHFLCICVRIRSCLIICAPQQITNSRENFIYSSSATFWVIETCAQCARH